MTRFDLHYSKIGGVAAVFYGNFLTFRPLDRVHPIDRNLL